LSERFPDLAWVLVGPDEGVWTSLSRLISDLGIQQRVAWMGQLPHERCLEALVDADVFLLTSRHEAHSMAMNEALAVGVPMIMTDTVGFNEAEQWGASKVVPVDPGSVADAIAEVLESPETAARMRDAGRRFVSERLAWPMVARAMKKTYLEILSNREAGQATAASR
jgi:glycosyltransferase involved in cell wall biosynthesis